MLPGITQVTDTLDRRNVHTLLTNRDCFLFFLMFGFIAPGDAVHQVSHDSDQFPMNQVYSPTLHAYPARFTDRAFRRDTQAGSLTSYLTLAVHFGGTPQYGVASENV